MHKILRIATEQFKVADVYCFMHVGNMHIMGLVAPSSCTAIEDSRSTCELMRMYVTTTKHMMTSDINTTSSNNRAIVCSK